MKEIQLSKGYVALVDDEDFERLSKHKWCASKGRNTVYAKSRIVNQNGEVALVYMHRFVLGLSDRKLLVDHIDKNGLNNCKSNLRACTTSENNRNSRLRKSNKSGYKGVFFVKEKKKYRVDIRVHTKSKFIGYFDSPIEAAAAYDAAAIKVHGEFAALNFP